MNQNSIILILVVAFFVVLVLLLISIYNKLVVKRNTYKNAFAQIDAVLMRRFDLIPNLVEVAKKYMEHESETLDAVTTARSQAQSALGDAKLDLSNSELLKVSSKSEDVLNSALGRLMAVVESYPDLKADAQMQSLHQELATTENLIAAHRQTFNIDTTDFNNALQVFPSNIVGALFGFKRAALYEIDDAKREAPKVQF